MLSTACNRKMAVMYLIEKISGLYHLCLGMAYGAVVCELDVSE